jgi:hypothetical protein
MIKFKTNREQLIDKKNSLRNQSIFIDNQIRLLTDKINKMNGFTYRLFNTNSHADIVSCEKVIENLHLLRDSVDEYFEIISNEVDKMDDEENN